LERTGFQIGGPAAFLLPAHHRAYWLAFIQTDPNGLYGVRFFHQSFRIAQVVSVVLSSG
jgi:hypothetical protein